MCNPGLLRFSESSYRQVNYLRLERYLWNQQRGRPTGPLGPGQVVHRDPLPRNVCHIAIRFGAPEPAVKASPAKICPSSNSWNVPLQRYQPAALVRRNLVLFDGGSMAIFLSGAFSMMPTNLAGVALIW